MIKNIKSQIRKNFNKIFWITNPNIINIEIAVEKNFFDIFAIDYEHSLLSIDEIRTVIIYLNVKKIPIFIRFSKSNFIEAPKFLDFGIDGVIVSDVGSYKELKIIKDVIFYPKIGKRGVGLGRMNKHGKNFQEYLNNFNNSLVFLPMIEKEINTQEIENIFKDPEVDGCLIGPYDLSMSLGKAGNFYSQRFIKIQNDILKMKKKYKKAAGLHFMDLNIKKLSLIKKKGFNFIPILTDVQFFKIGLDFLKK